MSGPSRFGTVNLIPAATLKNGSGGGAPAVVEYASYPLANVLEDDQYVIWNTGAAPGTPVQVDITLSAATAITAVSVHGLRVPAGSSVTSLKVYRQTGVYTPGGTWTLIGTVSNPGRHAGLTLASTSVDSLRYEFACTGQFQTGKFFAGAPWSVGGGTYIGNPGLESTPVRNAVLYELPSGSVFSFNLGDTGRDIAVALTELTETDMDTLQGLAALTSPFVFVDSRDRFWNVTLAGKSVPTRQTSVNPLYAVDLALKVIP